MVSKLSNATVNRLPASVETPAYDRASLTPGIVHIGLGNFHRAHQAVYLDRLFGRGLDHDWGVVGAGLKPNDEIVRADLADQDWLTTVVELGPEGPSARVCGSMIDYAEGNPDALIEWLSRADIRIVSLTITEGGYFIDAETGGLRLDHPDIQHDIDNPKVPTTAFGCIVAALSHRRQTGTAPFTVVSCDNIPENGRVTRDAVFGLAKASDPDLANWIAANVAFPNSMVDCITPATPDREREMIMQTFGIDDKRPVVCEPFRQWVLEDDFPSGRPALENVGVQFVEDVAPYELMKLRILNGGHAAIAYPASLLGVHYVHDAMANPLINAFLHKLVTNEIIPTVPEIQGVNFADYFNIVVERFSNPVICDTISRLCLDGSNRQPKFILPTIQARLDENLSIDGLALEVALWCRYCVGTDQSGQAIQIEDENAAELQEHAKRTAADPMAFLELDMIFGSLRHDEAFQRAFTSALRRIWKFGTQTALQHYIVSQIK